KIVVSSGETTGARLPRVIDGVITAELGCGSTEVNCNGSPFEVRDQREIIANVPERRDGPVDFTVVEALQDSGEISTVHFPQALAIVPQLVHVGYAGRTAASSF